MAHILERKIGQVRVRARRLLVLYALCWTIALLVATVLVIGVADYLIRIQDHGVRLMASLAVLLAFGWSVYRFGLLQSRQSLGDIAVARRIERRFPDLCDRLSSTIAFLKQSELDAHAGSAVLRRAVILETTSAAESLDFSQVFEQRPARRAMVAAGSALLAAAVIAIWTPDGARIALARLVRPWGDDAWPRIYQVQFREAPSRLAAGQTFEVELVKDAAHPLPPEVRIHYRYETGGGAIENEIETMHVINGAVVARKESVARPFWYRAEGGDDQSMSWIQLEVVEPPRIEALEITLHPPLYSGLPREAGEKSFHALRGTVIELAGTSTKKLRRATVHQEGGLEWSAELSSDAYGFSLPSDAARPFSVDKSGPYWIVLEDLEGLVGGSDDKWDIRAIADAPPTVTVEQPGGNIFVTPEGAVPVKVTAKDDLAIGDIALDYNRSDRTDVEDIVVPLYQGADRALPQQTSGLLATGQLGESHSVEHRWSLADLKLKPGSQITLWATAGDYLPQRGKSTVRRLSIITPDELEDRLVQRQALIFGELQRVLKMQQDARVQTRSLEIQMHEVGQLHKQDIDHAQAAELNQRQVTRTLTSATEGIPAQIADFLADLENNRVDNPEMQRHMSAIVAELNRLGQQHLGLIERALTSVIKAAQAKPTEVQDAPPAADPLIRESLHVAAENQEQVISSLETMLGELGQWDSYRRFAREIATLARDQQEIARSTKEMAPSTLGLDRKDLDQQQQADLKKLSSQQVELSRKLEKVQQQMAQMGDSLKQSDPLSAATISDGLHQAGQLAISGQMRKASEQLEKNQLGQAAQQQAKIAKDLDDLLSTLSNRREQELTRLVKQLRESEQELERLRKQQAGLRKRMRAAAEMTDETQRKRQLERLAREEKQLQEEAGRLARRLERLQADEASRSATGAAGKMGQAGDAGQEGDSQGAQQQAEQAQKDLEEAQQQLARRRRQAEEDLAREQLARLEDSLKSLHERQKKLIEDTQRLENLRSQGRFTRAQASTANDLAREQRLLQTETSLMADKLALAEVVNMALAGASKQMTRAAELLEHRDTGGPTQNAQEAARARLAQLLGVLQKKAGKEGASKPGGDEGGEGGGSRPDGIEVLTQLKLLKLLQEDVNSRFRELTEGRDEFAGPVAKDLAELAAEQGQLAELTLKLSEPPAENPEDDPQSLPDVREDAPPALSPPALPLDPTKEETP